MGLLFRLSNVLVLPVWALMILLPRWRWTTRIMRSPLVSAAPAALYGALVLPRLGEIWPAVSRPTLSGVATLLRSPEPFPADCNPIRWFVLIPDTPIFATARSAINWTRILWECLRKVTALPIIQRRRWCHPALKRRNSS